MLVTLEDNQNEHEQEVSPADFQLSSGQMLVVGRSPRDRSGRENLTPFLEAFDLSYCPVGPNFGGSRLSGLQIALYIDETDQARIIHLGRTVNRVAVQRFGEEAHVLPLPTRGRTPLPSDGERLPYAATVWLPVTRKDAPARKRLSVINPQAYIDEFGEPVAGPDAGWAGITGGPGDLRELRPKTLEAFIWAAAPLLRFPAVDMSPTTQALREHNEMWNHFREVIDTDLRGKVNANHRLIATLFAESAFTPEHLSQLRWEAINSGSYGSFVADALQEAARLYKQIVMELKPSGR